MSSSKKDYKSKSETKYIRKIQRKRKTTKLKYKLDERIRRPFPKQFEKMIELLENYEYVNLKQKERKLIWTQLTNELNAIGLHKSPQKWQKTFCDWKRSIKKKISENKSLTECEQKVFNIFLDKRSNNDVEDSLNDSNDGSNLNADESYQLENQNCIFFYDSNENKINHLLNEQGEEMILDRRKNDNLAIDSLENIDDVEQESTDAMQIVECKPEIDSYNGIGSTSKSTVTSSDSMYEEDVRSSQQLHDCEDVNVDFNSFQNNHNFNETNKSSSNGTRIANQITKLNQRLPNSNISVVAANLTRSQPLMTSNQMSISSTLESSNPPPLISINKPNKKFSPIETKNLKNQEIATRILEKVTNLETYFSSIDFSLKKIALSMEALVKK